MDDKTLQQNMYAKRVVALMKEHRLIMPEEEAQIRDYIANS
jgi:hypothetical protein